MEKKFVLAILLLCSIGLSFAEEETEGESTSSSSSVEFSVVAPKSRQRRGSFGQKTVVSGQPDSGQSDSGQSAAGQLVSEPPSSDDGQGECPDPELLAYYRHKYTATTPHNQTENFYRAAMGPHLYNMSSFAVSQLTSPDSLLALSTTMTKPKPVCTPIIRSDNETLEVQLVNSTSLLQLLGNKNDSFSHCTVVLFFAPWCMFCAQMAPHFNALPRAFPQLNFLAIDAIHFSSLNTRYGTIAVPNMLVFYNNSKAVAKYNHTERNYSEFVSFISGITGFKADNSVTVLPSDYDGPLSSSPTRDRDWLLWLAWIFVIICTTTMFVKSSIGQTIWSAIVNFGMEHQNHNID